MFTALGAQMPQSANYAAKIRHFGYICKYLKKKKKKINIFFRHNILHEISKNCNFTVEKCTIPLSKVVLYIRY